MYRGKISGEGLKGYGRPRMGCGGGAPSDAGEFSKICKIMIKKIAKNSVFSPFYKDTSKHCTKPSRVLMKNTTAYGNLAKILKRFNKNSIEKLNVYIIW